MSKKHSVAARILSAVRSVLADRKEPRMRQLLAEPLESRVLLSAASPTDYFPLIPRTTWDYSGTEDIGWHTIGLSDHRSLGTSTSAYGKTIVPVVDTAVAQGQTVLTTRYYSCDLSGGLRLYGQGQVNYYTGARSQVSFNTPLLVMDGTFQAPSVRSWSNIGMSATAYDPNLGPGGGRGTDSGTATVTDFGPITIGNTTYPDSLQLTIDHTETYRLYSTVYSWAWMDMTAHIIETAWLVQGIGPVKMDGSVNASARLYDGTTDSSTITSTMELTNFSPPPIMSITATNSTMTEGDPANPATFTVHRTGGDITQPMTVYYLLSGTAPTTRYTGHQAPKVGWVTIAANQTDATITLTPVNDSIVEPTQNVIVTLYPYNPYGVDPSNASAQATLLDNEPVISVTTDNGHDTMTEGDAANPATFTVHRTGDTSAALTVYYLLGGTAATTRYTGHQRPTVGWITFAPGNADASITLVPGNDAIYQGSKTVTVTLYPISTYSADTNAKVAQATLLDNEPVISVTTDNGHDTMTEGDAANPATFTVHRTGDTSAALTVYYLLGGTAATNRYTGHQRPAVGWVTFAPGNADASITLVPGNDAIYQGSKTVTVTLYPLTTYGADANAKVAQATLLDNESIVTIAADPGHDTFQPGGPPATFTAHRTGDTTNPLTVYYLLSGTAPTYRYTGHQRPAVGWVTFTAGQADASIQFTSPASSITGPAQTVLVTLYPLYTYGLDSNLKTAQASLIYPVI